MSILKLFYRIFIVINTISVKNGGYGFFGPPVYIRRDRIEYVNKLYESYSSK